MQISYGSLRPTFMVLFSSTLRSSKINLSFTFPYHNPVSRKFHSKKQNMSSRVLTVQLAHKDIHTLITKLSASSVPHRVQKRDCSAYTTKNMRFVRTNVKLRNEIIFYSTWYPSDISTLSCYILPLHDQAVQDMSSFVWRNIDRNTS
jgi:hypothetical protein